MNEIYDTQKTTITVSANGHPHEVPAKSTVADFLQEIDVTPAYVVVQVDGVLIARSEFEQIVLQQGNKIEIVTLVGGG
jgi:sulfur carrier protein